MIYESIMQWSYMSGSRRVDTAYMLCYVEIQQEISWIGVTKTCYTAALPTNDHYSANTIIILTCTEQQCPLQFQRRLAPRQIAVISFYATVHHIHHF